MAAIILSLACTSCAKIDYANVSVVKVIDGDTLEIFGGERVRLIGIDTPEVYESDKLYRDSQRTGQDIRTITAMGRKAYEFTKELVEGKEVQLEFDVERKDEHGRLLAYVRYEITPSSHLKDLDIPDNIVTDCRINKQGYDGTFVFLNATIIKSGYATPMAIPPNIQYAHFFQKLYQEAKKNKEGLHKE